VSQISASSTPISLLRPGLPARLAILAAVFFTDKVVLNGFVDFDRAQAAQGLGALVRDGQHWGFRFLVATAAAIVLFAYVRDGQELKAASASVRGSKLRIGWMLAHVLLVGCLMPLSYWLYPEGAAPLPFAAVAVLWIGFGGAAALSAVLALAPGAIWLNVARALGIIWCYATIAALLGASAMQLSQRLWEPTAAVTFDLVRRVLLPIIPTLSADPATRVLSTERFAVEIAEICSGLEGMGLMLAFCAAWLLYFRREYIFPRALLLIPVGLLAIFVLNVLRIAALMLIGNAGFPDVAEYGFHSQAGWIAFNTVACGLVLFSRRSAWLNRSARTAAPTAIENPTAAYLMPLLAILAAGAVSHAMSGSFENFYPLRLIAGIAMFARYRHRLGTLDWRWSWRGPAVGVVIFLLWTFGAHLLTPGAPMPDQLAAMPAAVRGLWVISRIGASVLVVPIAEELAYRGYLMRRLINHDFESVPFRSVRWPAVLVTAVVSGLAHGELWLPGIAAGVAYGFLVVRRGTLGEAVAAHATTNALVVATVLAGDQWQLW